MRRKKVVLLCLVVVCMIGAIITIIVNKKEEPKNVFEEMYAAEMEAAEKNAKLAEGQAKLHTPLSNTEYFEAAVAEYIDYHGTDDTSSRVKELPRESSPYTISVGEFIHMGEKSPMGRNINSIKKIVSINSSFFYQHVNIEIHYQYVVSSEGKVKKSVKEYEMEDGLYISVKTTIDNRRIFGYEDLSAYGLEEDDLRIQVERNLNHILNYWVDNYPESKFKHDDFGTYEIIEN